MNFNWSLAQADPATSARLAAEANVSPLLAQCLMNRGFRNGADAAEFLDPKLRHLADPFLLPNMDKAVARLLAARARGELVVIFGDYDVDGVTSTALLFESLSALGWKLKYYLPSRLTEGYGLTQEAVAACVKDFSRFLLLAVDCGSTATGPIAWLKTQGIDVIVLDHHQVSDPAPDAVALVNPQLGARFHELCSAGLAFKLAHALAKQMRADGEAAALAFDIRQHLDLAALGTVADLVPLTGESRILVHAGLPRLDVTPRAGLCALKTVAKSTIPIGVQQVGFQLGPRLNAAGRLLDAGEALRLLLTADKAEAEAIAVSLDGRNRQRQEIERAICEEALEIVRRRFEAARDYVIVEGSSSWHIGVVGIVASRVLQKFYRPTIIFGGDNGAWRGSGRSIDGFDLAATLGDCREFLLRHGGHAMAAGLSMEAAKIDSFRARINELARSILKPEQLRPTLALDAATTLDELTLARVEELARLEPCGMMNPAVRVALRGVAHQQPPQRMGRENQHVKFRVTDGRRMLEAVWWNCGEAPLPKIRFDLAVTPTINEYNGRRTVQLKVLDWQ
ncbi:MAG TPA: single-stranded-DNA-specific exonuclease RecJ [Verrucomicrobiae bacterium]|jgi:single-stranded-DNA-specific exonuclease|nr:single-stranded-DNA-specific exonuclease RecJ [Verrucomicrobiae bacterium]